MTRERRKSSSKQHVPRVVFYSSAHSRTQRRRAVVQSLPTTQRNTTQHNTTQQARNLSSAGCWRCSRFHVKATGWETETKACVRTLAWPERQEPYLLQNSTAGSLRGVGFNLLGIPEGWGRAGLTALQRRACGSDRCRWLFFTVMRPKTLRRLTTPKAELRNKPHNAHTHNAHTHNAHTPDLTSKAKGDFYLCTYFCSTFQTRGRLPQVLPGTT